jgi:hypothetical protein
MARFSNPKTIAMPKSIIQETTTQAGPTSSTEEKPKDTSTDTSMRNNEPDSTQSAETLTPAQIVIFDYLHKPIKNASDKKTATKETKKTSAANLAGKALHFQQAEQSVDVYENILNKDANLLAKTMEVASLEVDKSVANAAEVGKSLASAKGVVSAAKTLLANADDAATKLWDVVRRDSNSDVNVKKIREKMGQVSAQQPEEPVKWVLNTTVEEYAVMIQEASDKMNEALLAVNSLSVELKTEEMKRLAQETKAKTDAFKADLAASLEFSKDKLKKTHTDLLAATAADTEADYNVKFASNGVNSLEALKVL